MTKIKSPIDVLKLLGSSNCGKCNKRTCLAFAGAVFKGEAGLDGCPKLSSQIIEQYGGMESGHVSSDELANNEMEEFKAQIPSIDLAAAAERLGVDFSDGKLTIRMLGKNVSVDTEGTIFTEIHVNQWVATLVYIYIINGAGNQPSGKWVTFRELDGVEYFYPLFQQRCENPLRRLADRYPGLFEDMLHVFNGKQVDYHYFADISVLLYPLPKVPIMICYSKPEDDMESSLSVFFDSTIVENLGIGGAFGLGFSLTLMFEKIAMSHVRR